MDDQQTRDRQRLARLTAEREDGAFWTANDEAQWHELRARLGLPEPTQTTEKTTC